MAKMGRTGFRTFVRTLCASAALLGGCLPSGKEGSRCAGYLGCSTAQTILPADGGNGAPPPPLPPIGTGCGKPLPAGQPMTVPGTPTGYMHYTVNGTGASLAGPQPQKIGPRTFWVRVPADYDRNHRYRVVYLAHECGGYEVANTATIPLYDESMGGDEEAIYVALDIPRDMANMDCYDTDSGLASQEWEAFQLFQSVVDQNYCVDNDRVYVLGHAFGGALANQWGCYFAGDGTMPASDPEHRRAFAPQYHLRAQAAVDGVEPDNNPPCNGPIAGIWIHDVMSPDPYAGGEAARDRALRMNDCVGSPTAPWHPEIFSNLVPGADPMTGCLQYTACPAAYPVVFCTTVGQGLSVQRDRVIPAVTAFYEELERAADGGAPGPDAGSD